MSRCSFLGSRFGEANTQARDMCCFQLSNNLRIVYRFWDRSPAAKKWVLLLSRLLGNVYPYIFGEQVCLSIRIFEEVQISTLESERLLRSTLSSQCMNFFLPLQSSFLTNSHVRIGPTDSITGSNTGLRFPIITTINMQPLASHESARTSNSSP